MKKKKAKPAPKRKTAAKRKPYRDYESMKDEPKKGQSGTQTRDATTGERVVEGVESLEQMERDRPDTDAGPEDDSQNPESGVEEARKVETEETETQ